jgi:peptidyl-prolyl cis-trans isomerase B (cyclophilin B)
MFGSLAFLALIVLGSCAGPKAHFSYEHKEYHAPVSLRFENQSRHGESYHWDFGDGHTSGDYQPEHHYSLSGNYKVVLTAKKNGKSSTSVRELHILPPHHCMVEMETTEGTMVIRLHDETPQHRDNFIKLVEEGYYNGLLFHRVIKSFMVQGGDPDSKNASPGKRLGMGGPTYKVPAEMADTLVHIKGALAAARMGDPVNPSKASSGSQFYIVQGRTCSKQDLDNYELQKNIRYTDYARQIYMQEGGSPQLDKEYTVFGQVVRGLDVIDRIADAQTDGSDRPVKDVKIIKTRIVN